MHAAFADECVKSFRKILNEVPGEGALGCVDDFILSGVGTSVADVAAQIASKQDHLLRHEGDPLAVAPQIEFVGRGVAHPELSTVGRVKAQQEGSDRAFARPTRADQGHLVSSFDSQIQSFQHRHIGPLGIVEMDIFQGHGVAQGHLWGGGVEVDDFSVLVDDVHHRFDGTEAALKRTELGGHPADAPGHQPRHQKESEEVLARKFALLHQVRPFEYDKRDCPKNEQDDEACERATPQRTAHGEAFDFSGMRPVFPALEPFVGVTLHTDNGRQHILHDDVGGSHLVLGLFGQLSDEATKHHCRQNHDRQGAQHPQREFHREIRKRHDATHNQDQAAKQLGKRDGENVLDGGDVRADSAVQVADAPGIVKGHRHAHQGVKSILAHGEHHLFRHVGEQQNPNKREERLDGQGAKKRPPHRRQIVHLDAQPGQFSG